MSYSVIVKVDPGINTSITGSPGHAWIEIYGPGGAGPNGLIGAYGFSSLNSEPFGPGQVRNEGVRQFESANGYTSPSIPLTGSVRNSVFEALLRGYEPVLVNQSA